jgi:Glycosyltransferase family 10 (fucosyltransferase) C-term
MIIVKFINDSADWRILRQTPGEKGVWGNCLFLENDSIYECDWLVVYNHVLKPERVLCPPENTIYIDPEPPSIRLRSLRFLKQFNYILTCRRDIKRKGVINVQQALPWHVGMQLESSGRHGSLDFTLSSSLGFTMGYDELRHAETPNKTRLLSVISSDKSFTDGHRKRQAFVNLLKGRFGDGLEVYGRGVRDIKDKWDAIAEYKYHVVIENSVYRDYWTEKLADCFLAGAYPFYHGCPNLYEYFPSGSFTEIDINKPKEAIDIIEKGIRSQLYENSLHKLRDAKELVLDKHNLFAMLSGIIEEENSKSRRGALRKRVIILKPDGFPSVYRSLAKKILGKKIVSAIHKLRYG